jgi:hypothetical protein
MRNRILLLVALAACSGGAAPKVTADPARGLRTLTTEDPDVTAIAIEAARALPRNGPSAAMPRFAGVFVEGRRSRPATDAVTRVTGFTPVTNARTATPQCRAVNTSTGQSINVPCPASATAVIPPTYSFTEVRATADSAYVGVTESSGNSDKVSCMTLIHRGVSWVYFGTMVTANARNCGK